jgi:hypothetical protein
MMKPRIESAWKQRVVFFLAACLFAFVCLVIQLKWMAIVPYAAFDSQPGWLKGFREFVGLLPWLAFATVLVLRFVKGRRIRVGFYFLGTATPTVILIAWMMLGPSVADLVHRRQFDAELWRKQAISEPDTMWPPRLCMVDHLISSGLLDGLSHDEVLELLGPPSQGIYLGDATYDYYLGPERGFIRLDSEWLLIAFGEDNKVSRYWLARD